MKSNSQKVVQWHSVEEAARAMGSSEAEIRRAVFQGNIRAAIYSPARDFLVFSVIEDGNIVGHAVCRYLGPLWVHSTFLDKLLSAEDICLDGKGARPLDPSGLSRWSADCPFEKLPISNLVGWQSYPEPIEFEGALYMTPLPKEYPTGSAIVRNSLDKMPEASKAGDFGKLMKVFAGINQAETALDFRSNSRFSPDSLVISVEMERHPSAAVDKPESKHNSLPLSPPLERKSQITCLLWAILREDLDQSADDVWQKLIEDFNRAGDGEPIYDIEHILRDIDSECLVWQGRRKKTETTLKRTTFESKLSKLRGLGRKLVAAA